MFLFRRVWTNDSVVEDARTGEDIPMHEVLPLVEKQPPGEVSTQIFDDWDLSRFQVFQLRRAAKKASVEVTVDPPHGRPVRVTLRGCNGDMVPLVRFLTRTVDEPF